MSLSSPKFRILSLGAGVQSSTVLLMSCRGELPKLDAAVFADTGWEPRAVYRHLAFLEAVAQKHGLCIERVSAGNIKEDALRSRVRNYNTAKGERWSCLPYFTVGLNGSKGMLRRQCTKEYKLEPIRKAIRGIAGYKPRQRIPHGTVEQWIGISADEWKRARGSGEMWRLNRYPLIELGMTRAGCLEWMQEHGYAEPPRSACIGCPYHRDDEWRWLRDNEPQSFEDACQFDEAIRHCGGTLGDVFLHSQRVPLREADLRTDADFGQTNFLDTLCPTCMM